MSDKSKTELIRELDRITSHFREFTAILKVIPDIIYRIDPKGNIVFISDSVRNLGYAPEELIGRHFSVLIHPEDLDQCSRDRVLPNFIGKVTGDDNAPKLFDERRTGKRATKGLVVRMVPKSGDQNTAADNESVYGEVMASGQYSDNAATEPKQFLGTVGTIRDLRVPQKIDFNMLAAEKEGPPETPAGDGQPGQFSGTVGIIRDITARMHLEEEKSRLLQQVYFLQKMESIGQLAGGIAHDFNNILGAISGYADIIQKRYTSNADPKLTKYVSMILSASKRAAELTTKLLAFARKGRYQNVVVDIHQMIRDVIQLVSHSFDKRIVIRQTLEASHFFITGDPDQIQNAIMNLVINARDAMPDGGELSIETETVQVDREFIRKRNKQMKTGTCIRVSVRDTGTGMDEQTRAHLFEPFFTTKEIGKGTGLGLASVYGIVEAHEGIVEAESEKGNGSVFNLYLPVVRKSHPTKVRKTETEPGVTNVMIVDDEELIRETCMEMLKDLGYSVTAFSNGREALDYFRDNAELFSVAIVDMVMPDMGGKECMEKLLEIKPDLKVLLSTGYVVEKEIQKEHADGVRVIHKPFLSDELARAIKGLFHP